MITNHIAAAQWYSPRCPIVHPMHLITYMLPWNHPSPNSKRYLDRFNGFAQLTAERPYTLQRTALPPLKLPLSMGDLDSHLHRESKKGCHPNHGYNFVSSWSICKIISLLQTVVNFQQNPYWVTHHTLSMLLHYLGKLKNQKSALCVHVKHVSNVIFIICPRDIWQMSWK